MAMEMRPLIEFLELQVEQTARKQEIGEQIKFARLARGQTQSETAAAIGVTQAYLSQVESGDRTPSLETMNSIVNYFGGETGGADAQDQD